MIEEGAKPRCRISRLSRRTTPAARAPIEVEYKVTDAVDKLRRVQGVEIVDDAPHPLHARTRGGTPGSSSIFFG